MGIPVYDPDNYCCDGCREPINVSVDEFFCWHCVEKGRNHRLALVDQVKALRAEVDRLNELLKKST